MIFNCKNCGKVYVPHPTNACPTCGESESLKEMAEREIKRLEPLIVSKFGEYAEYREIARTKEGREYIGWMFLLGDQYKEFYTYKIVNAKREVFLKIKDNVLSPFVDGEFCRTSCHYGAWTYVRPAVASRVAMRFSMKEFIVFFETKI